VTETEFNGVEARRSRATRIGRVVSDKGHKTIVVEVDTGRVDVARTHWPFLRDRRVDAYGGMTSRYLDEG